MKKQTELVIIIDKSGSMHGLENDVVGGFNSLLEEQKKDGDVIATVIFFNDTSKYLYQNMNIQDIKKIDRRNYVPSGCTALLDAIGDAICFIKGNHALLKEEEIPEHTIFSIMTDGYENASREYSYKKIKDMIEFQKKCGWDFIFQAANIDVVKECDRLGINVDCADSFVASTVGVRKMTSNVSKRIKTLKRR